MMSSLPKVILTKKSGFSSQEKGEIALNQGSWSGLNDKVKRMSSLIFYN